MGAPSFISTVSFGTDGSCKIKGALAGATVVLGESEFRESETPYGSEMVVGCAATNDLAIPAITIWVALPAGQSRFRSYQVSEGSTAEDGGFRAAFAGTARPCFGRYWADSGSLRLVGVIPAHAPTAAIGELSARFSCRFTGLG